MLQDEEVSDTFCGDERERRTHNREDRQEATAMTRRSWLKLKREVGQQLSCREESGRREM